MDLQKVLEKLANVKKYSTKKVNPELIIEAIEAANLAPAPGNLQALRYILVGNLELKDDIAESCQQEFIKNAPFLVVICSDDTDVKRFFDVRSDQYIRHYAGAAAQNFLLKIIELGLASCLVSAFVEENIRKTLRIPDNINVEIILTVGYKLVSDKKRPKRPLSLNKKVFFESWGNTYGRPFEITDRETL